MEEGDDHKMKTKDKKRKHKKDKYLSEDKRKKSKENSDPEEIQIDSNEIQKENEYVNNQKINNSNENIKDSEINTIDNPDETSPRKSKKKKKHKNKDREENYPIINYLDKTSAPINEDVTEGFQKINRTVERKQECFAESNLETVNLEEFDCEKKSRKKKKHKKQEEREEELIMPQNVNSNHLETLNDNDFNLGHKHKKKKKHKEREKIDNSNNILNVNEVNTVVDSLTVTENNLLSESEKVKKKHSKNKENKNIENDEVINETENVFDKELNTENVVELTIEEQEKVKKKKKKKEKHKERDKRKQEEDLNDKHFSKHKKKHKKMSNRSDVEETEKNEDVEECNKENEDNEFPKTSSVVNISDHSLIDNHEKDVYLENLDIADYSTNDEEIEDKGCFYNFEGEELNFEPPILHGNGTPTPLTKQQKETFSALGIQLKMGKWTKSEDKILTRNWKNFIEKYNLKAPHVLLGLGQNKEKVVKKFIHAKKFYFQLAKDLNNRSIHSCYLRARKLFHIYREDEKKGWTGTPEEFIDDLERLVSIYGKKWTKIGHIVKRDAKNVSEIIRWHRKNAIKGHWSEEEEEQLIHAVKTVIQSEDVAGIYYGIQWEEVAKLVPTRNSQQCRQHWLLNTCWKINQDNKPRERWKDADTIRLIYHLYRLPTDDEKDVDWDELALKFDNVASYASLKQKWAYFKQKVPGYQNKDFEDIITYLYCKYLPSLLKKIGKSFIEEILETV